MPYLMYMTFNTIISDMYLEQSLYSITSSCNDHDAKYSSDSKYHEISSYTPYLKNRIICYLSMEVNEKARMINLLRESMPINTLWMFGMNDVKMDLFLNLNIKFPSLEHITICMSSERIHPLIDSKFFEFVQTSGIRSLSIYNTTIDSIKTIISNNVTNLTFTECHVIQKDEFKLFTGKYMKSIKFHTYFAIQFDIPLRYFNKTSELILSNYIIDEAFTGKLEIGQYPENVHITDCTVFMAALRSVPHGMVLYIHNSCTPINTAGARTTIYELQNTMADYIKDGRIVVF